MVGARPGTEGKGAAVVGARAVVLGALARAEGTFVGFVGHIPTNPTNVAVRGALALVSGTRGFVPHTPTNSPFVRRRAAERAATARRTASAPPAATPFPSMMQ